MGILQKTKKQLYRNLKRRTLKRIPSNISNMKDIPQTISYSDLSYLGNGSFGTVFAIPGFDKPYALKEHVIHDVNIKQCGEWANEYNMQKKIYTLCNSKIKHMKISIARPYVFSFGTKIGDTLVKQKNEQGSTSCFFIMERILGRYPGPFRLNTETILNAEREGPNEIVEAKLAHILKGGFRPKTLIPPYMFLGDIEGDGKITLDMIKDSHLHEFPKQELNYCTIGVIGYGLLRNMTASFFTIINAGFIPRDIEYVLNGNDPDVLMSIIDFNEVKTLSKRREIAGADYDINEDCAHVYIDLCGLRKKSTRNPQAPYDDPTPQWKFLCNPLRCPEGYERLKKDMCANFPTVDYDMSKIFSIIDDYVRIHYYSKPALKIPEQFLSWNGSEFERYIIYSLFSVLLRKKQLVVDDTFFERNYAEMLMYIDGLTKENIIEDDWPLFL